MLCISSKEFIFWKKKQLSKGGDYQSFAVLLECVAGITNSDLTMININQDGCIYLKKNLDFLESFIKLQAHTTSLWSYFLARSKIKSNR